MIAAACLNFIKTSDALSHEAILEKLIQTDLAVARVTWAVNEWRTTKCNNKPLSLVRQLVSIQMNLALCKTWALLCFYFVRQEYLWWSHKELMKYAQRLGILHGKVALFSISRIWERRLLHGIVTILTVCLYACLGMFAVYNSHDFLYKFYNTWYVFFKPHLLNSCSYHQNIKSKFPPVLFAEKAWNIE